MKLFAIVTIIIVLIISFILAKAITDDLWKHVDINGVNEVKEVKEPYDPKLETYRLINEGYTVLRRPHNWDMFDDIVANNSTPNGKKIIWY